MQAFENQFSFQLFSTQDLSWSQDRSQDLFLKVIVSCQNQMRFDSVLFQSQTKRTLNFLIKTGQAHDGFIC